MYMYVYYCICESNIIMLSNAMEIAPIIITCIQRHQYVYMYVHFIYMYSSCKQLRCHRNYIY